MGIDQEFPSQEMVIEQETAANLAMERDQQTRGDVNNEPITHQDFKGPNYETLSKIKTQLGKTYFTSPLICKLSYGNNVNKLFYSLAEYLLEKII